MLRLLAALLVSTVAFSATSGTTTPTVHSYAKVAAFDGATPGVSALRPGDLHAAYQLPTEPIGTTKNPIVAIVDAYSYPTAEVDLATFDTQYQLPACTTGNGCLRIVNQDGGGTLPAPDAQWSLEMALDLQTVHAICQTCRILLVEAGAPYFPLVTGIATAARLGAVAISLSWGGVESAADPAINVPGVAVVASTGDDGYGTSWPATSPHVVAAGGTTLTVNDNGSWQSETAWKGAGSGCSTLRRAVWWQTTLPAWHRTGCGSHRLIADIAADADPQTGVSIYDSTPYKDQAGWFQVGGTSLSAPIIAAAFGLAGGIPAGRSGNWVIYRAYVRDHSVRHDILLGSTGTCATSACQAGRGLDGPTGIGSLRGLGALEVTP